MTEPKFDPLNELNAGPEKPLLSILVRILPEYDGGPSPALIGETVVIRVIDGSLEATPIVIAQAMSKATTKLLGDVNRQISEKRRKKAPK